MHSPTDSRMLLTPRSRTRGVRLPSSNDFDKHVRAYESFEKQQGDSTNAILAILGRSVQQSLPVTSEVIVLLILIHIAALSKLLVESKFTKIRQELRILKKNSNLIDSDEHCEINQKIVKSQLIIKFLLLKCYQFG